MKYKFENINCNLCNSNDYDKITDKGKFGIPSHVVLCKNCGLGYLNPRWTKESYGHFYKYEYDRLYRPDLDKGTSLNSKEKNPIVVRLKEYGLFPEQARNILDIGSGEGANLRTFKTIFNQSRLFAIEPSIESHKVLKNLGVEVIDTDVESSWEDGLTGKFDIIIMRHVLEHFSDPLLVLKKVNQVLSPKGILYIAVPNSLSPYQNLEKSWFRNVHTFYYNKYTITNMLHKENLSILRLTEGDKLNKGEMFLFARKSFEELKVDFSKEHYIIQKKVFSTLLKKQRTVAYKLTETIRRGMQKLTLLFRKYSLNFK